MSERVKVNVKVSSEVNTILHDLFNQIQYELCEQYEEEIERLKSQLDFIGEQNKYIDKLEKLLQQKENIIKEVREYVEETDRLMGPGGCHGCWRELYEILDKAD